MTIEDPKVAAALIAAFVSLVGAIIGGAITVYVSHQRSNDHDRQLEHLKDKIEVEIEALRQAQFSQVLEKRLECYSSLWEINIRYETNWVIEQKEKNGLWAREYLKDLNTFNLKNGLYLSQDLYSKFAELRSVLSNVSRTTNEDELVHESLVKEARSIVYGVSGNPGLSTYLKDDLGSYRETFVQKRIDNNA